MATNPKNRTAKVQGAASPPNVFISWSKPRSRHVAGAIYDALKLAIDAVRPWKSDEDIRTGKAWFPEIVSQLKSIEVGVVCLTPENLHEPWLNFEAGAIAGKVSNESLVIPVLIGGVRNKDVKPPLSMYQSGSALDPVFMLKLMRAINAATGGTVAPDVLDKKFAMLWPTLEAQIKKMPAPDEKLPKETNVDEALDELLNLVRGIRADVAPQGPLDAIFRAATGVPMSAIADKVAFRLNPATGEVYYGFPKTSFTIEDVDPRTRGAQRLAAAYRMVAGDAPAKPKKPGE